VVDAARTRLDEDPNAVFLVTGRLNLSRRGDNALTGSAVGSTVEEPVTPAEEGLVDDLVEHVLATLLLETDRNAGDLAIELAEIEAGLATGGSA
jgi:hypothetical protein